MKVRNTLCILLVVLMLLSLTACGGAAESMDKAYNGDVLYDSDMPAEAPEAGFSKAESESTTTALPADRKLIRTISIDAETEDLTALLDAVNSRITQLGGYVEAKNLRNGSNYSSYRTRNLEMTVRIPADKADSFVEQISEKSNIVSSSESVDDVTLQYVDTESQVKALEIEQERLLSLLEKAETLKDILTLEERLTDVRYELERYASRLRSLDNQITYATIHLSVTEVKEYTPVVEEEPTVWERIAGGFGRSLKDIGEDLTEFFIWVVVNSPYLLIWGVIGTTAFLVIRKKRGKGFRRRKAAPPENQE